MAIKTANIWFLLSYSMTKHFARMKRNASRSSTCFATSQWQCIAFGLDIWYISGVRFFFFNKRPTGLIAHLKNNFKWVIVVSFSTFFFLYKTLKIGVGETRVVQNWKNKSLFYWYKRMLAWLSYNLWEHDK